MTYGCQIWGQSFTETYINKIQTLQNNALRLISFAQDFRDHVSPIYTNCNLLKIKDLIILKNIIFIHDFLNNKLPVSFDGYFSIIENYKENHQLNEVNSRKIRPPAKYNEYDLTEPDMQPQKHADHYRFRNMNIQGELNVPKFKSKKYGRNSLKCSSVLSWNFFKRLFPDVDFKSLSRENLKKIISGYFIDKYRQNVLE